MSVERFHSQQHIQAYDTTYVGLAGGGLEKVAYEIDELLYPEEECHRPAGALRARVGDGIVFAGFNYEYLRTEVSPYARAVESVRLSIDHTQYLGRNALKQCYKIKLDTSLEQAVVLGSWLVTPPVNRVTAMFYLEEFPAEGDEKSFRGQALRPNIIGEQNQSDEHMTAYDCSQLYKAIHDARQILRWPVTGTNVL